MPEYCGNFTGIPDADALRLALEQQKEHTHFLEARVSNLRARNERLLRANRLKDSFLAGVSHELRTPLTSILGWAELLTANGIEDFPTEFQEAISTIYSSASTMAQLIEDLIDLARIQNNKLQLKYELIDLRKPIVEAFRLTRRHAEMRGVSFHSDLPSTPLHIHADSVRIHQILWNLLTNAVKFTPQGGSVQIELHEVSDGAKIIVSDTGRGIDAQALPHIFDQFWQIEHPNSDAQSGLGLGLAIVQGLVTAHGGSVSAHSSGTHCGAQFTIHLPRIPPQNSQTDWEIFIIDSDPVVRHLLGDVLDQFNCHSKLFEHPHMAIETLERHAPSVIFLETPPLDGDKLELLRFIRQTPRLATLLIIALTPSVTPNFLREVQTADIDGFLLKPVYPADLEKMLRQLRRLAVL